MLLIEIFNVVFLGF